MPDFETKMRQNPISVGALPQTRSVGELTALLQTPLLDLRMAGEGSVVESKKIHRCGS